MLALAVAIASVRLFVFAAPVLRTFQAKQPIQKSVFAVLLGITLLVYLCVWCASYPGGSSPDTLEQWRQVTTGRFNDWHPFFHTLILWLLSRICNSYSFVHLIHIVAFAVGVAYLFATLHAWGYSPLWAAVFGIIVFSPANQGQLSFASKDTALSILLLFLFTQMVNIYHSDGAWLQKRGNAIAFAALVAASTLVRHNAFLFTLPLAVGLLFRYPAFRKRSIAAVSAALVLVLAVKIPLSALLKVEKDPTQTYGESIGVPMTILTSVYLKSPESLPEDARTFLAECTPDIRNLIQFGEYNAVKFGSDIRQRVLQVPPLTLLQWTWQTMRQAPMLSLLAVMELTDMVWNPLQTKGTLVINSYADSPSLHLLPSSAKTFATTFLQTINRFLGVDFVQILSSRLGVLLLAILLSWLVSFKRSGFSTLWLFLPFVFYNLGTMLLLCAGDYRFFHFTCLLAWPLALLMLSKPVGSKN